MTALDYALLSNLDKKYLWHPFTQMQEWEREEILIFERGEGNYLYDIKGNKYLDGISSLWMNIFGHNHPELNAAILDQVSKLAHSTLLGSSNVPAIQYAEKLVGMTPGNLSRVFYSDAGATAVEIALKIALQYRLQKSPGTHKTKFLSTHGGYHGDTIGAVSVGGIDLFHRIYKPLIFETYKVHYPYPYRCPNLADHTDCEICSGREMVHAIEKHRDELAAVIIEPIVQGANGMIVMPGGFLKKIQTACRENDVLLILDEVATGFGRTGRLFACEHENVEPDILCLAKGITGGYLPLAATLTTEEIFQAFYGPYDAYKTFYHGHSYCGNPVGCAAASKCLEIFERDNVIEKIQPVITHFSSQLEKICNLPHVGEVRQKGFMAGIELVQDKESRTPYPIEKRMGHKVILDARTEGLFIRPLHNVIVLMPPLSITEEEIDFLTGVTSRSIQRVTEGG